MIDITERKNAEQRLQQSIKRYRSLAEDMPILICTFGADTKVTYCNKAMLDFTGMKYDEIVGNSSILDLIEEKDKQFLRKNILGYFTPEKPLLVIEVELLNYSAEPRTINWYIRAFFDDFDNIKYYQAFGVDITEKKQRELEQKKDDARHAMLLELYSNANLMTDKEIFDYIIDKAVLLTDSKIGFIHRVVNRNGEIEILLTTWNHESLKHCKAEYDSHYPLAKAGNWADCVRENKAIVYNDYPNSPNRRGHPEGHNPIQRLLTVPVVESGQTEIIFGVGNKETDYNEKDLQQVQLISNELQKIIGRRKVLAQLRTREAELSSYFEQAPYGIIISDVDGKILSINDKALEILRYSKVELINSNFGELIHRKDTRRYLSAMVDIFEEGGTDIELRFIAKDKSIKLFSFKAVNLNSEQFICFISDITKQRAAEKEFVEVMSTYSDIVQSIPAGLFIYQYEETDKLYLISANPEAERLTGITIDEWKGKEFNEIWERANETMLLGNFLNAYHSNSIYETDDLFYKDSRLAGAYKIKAFRLPADKLAIAFEDVSSSKQVDLIRKSLIKIAESVVTTDSLKELLAVVEEELSIFIDTSNIIFAMYDEIRNTFTSVYEKDEKDKIEEWSAEKSLTGLVVKNKKPMLFKKKDIFKMADEGIIELIGSRSEVWLGVPLMFKGKVLGAIVLQSYNNSSAYSEGDINTLQMFAGQISLFIQRKQYEDELIAAKEKAEEADILKSAFLANMSHEIRTPMNAIIGFSSLLETEELSKEEQKDFLSIINKKGNDLLALINDILDLSKIESGQISIYKTQSTIKPIFDELLTTYESTTGKYERILETKRKNIDFRIGECIPDNFYFSSDFHRIKQILNNLVNNATKFTGEGFIEFGCYFVDNNNYIEFYVKDTGCGIPSDKLESIFNRFEQVDSEYQTRNYGGAGLGLSIVRGLVELLGGKIRVESELGNGSTFYFTIPVLKSKENNMEKKFVTKPKVNLEKYRILLAEDDESNYIITKLILERHLDADIVLSVNGIDATEKALSQDFDLVLMDIKMPKLSGIDAFKRIKEQKPDLPIIALTAYALNNDKERILDEGFDGYLAKPFAEKDLIDIIIKVVENK